MNNKLQDLISRCRNFFYNAMNMNFIGALMIAGLITLFGLVWHYYYRAPRSRPVVQEQILIEAQSPSHGSQKNDQESPSPAHDDRSSSIQSDDEERSNDDNVECMKPNKKARGAQKRYHKHARKQQTRPYRRREERPEVIKKKIKSEVDRQMNDLPEEKIEVYDKGL